MNTQQQISCQTTSNDCIIKTSFSWKVDISLFPSLEENVHNTLLPSQLFWASFLFYHRRKTLHEQREPTVLQCNNMFLILQVGCAESPLHSTSLLNFITCYIQVNIFPRMSYWINCCFEIVKSPSTRDTCLLYFVEISKTFENQWKEL